MTAGSPAAYLLWAILSCIFQVFMVLHLWAYDRLQCLRWSSGRQPGAFKRAMTYSYLATLPLLVLFSVSLAIIKYKEGYVVNGDTICPRPISEWSPSSHRWVLPLYFILSVAWAFELVTHLEELTFWLFLLHQGPSKRVWFQSWEFRIWYLGSLIAVIGMPLVTLIKRHVLDACLSWIFLTGSSAGAATTICFFYVIVRFPRFIRQVKSEGVEPDVVVRLVKYYHLNVVRIIFRLFFNFSLLIIGVDGIKAPYPVLQHSFWADVLLMIGGVGCFVSSALTLQLFFPRSASREADYASQKAPPPSFANGQISTSLPRYHVRDPSPKIVIDREQPNLQEFRFPAGSQYSLPMHSPGRSSYEGSFMDADIDNTQEGHGDRMPQRAEEGDQQRKGAVVSRHFPVQEETTESANPSFVHPYVMTFTSPIDFCDEDHLPPAISSSI